MAGPLVLGFDTSAAHCAAALLEGDRLIAATCEPMQKGQVERLFPLLEDMLAGASVGWRDLAGIGAGTGPGNFTGVRITIASARGLALSLGIPAIGVNGFEALAHGLAHPVLASLDARRGQSYLQIVGGGTPLIADPRELTAPFRDSGLDVVGHDAKTLAAGTGGKALTPVMPQAEAIARIAAARLHAPGPQPAPLYLRSADAAPPSERPPVILP